MKRIALAASALAVGLTFASSPVRAVGFLFTMNFTESGSCNFTGGPSLFPQNCTTTFESDPSSTPLTTGQVLIITLPSPTFTGQVNILSRRADNKRPVAMDRFNRELFSL
jgi:hypothetical protein